MISMYYILFDSFQNNRETNVWGCWARSRGGASSRYSSCDVEASPACGRSFVEPDLQL